MFDKLHIQIDLSMAYFSASFELISLYTNLAEIINCRGFLYLVHFENFLISYHPKHQWIAKLYIEASCTSVINATQVFTGNEELQNYIDKLFTFSFKSVWHRRLRSPHTEAATAYGTFQQIVYYTMLSKTMKVVSIGHRVLYQVISWSTTWLATCIKPVKQY